MNKTVKPIVTFSQVWLSQNVSSSQSKGTIAMSISSLKLGRQLLGKCKWTTSIVNSNLVNEWDCQIKVSAKPIFTMTVPNSILQWSQECQQVPIW